MIGCEYCSPEKYKPLNDTTDFSGIEIVLMPSIGIMRVRYGYELEWKTHGIDSSQDVVQVNFCPMCGRRINNEYKAVR